MNKVVDICIVDDYIVNIFVLEEYLKDNDKYKIVSFTSGHDCIEYITNNSVDIILMDCNMPILSGYDTTKIVKQIKPDVKVIGVTANTYNEDIQKCYSVGMEDVIIKPIIYDSIISKIDALVSKNKK